MARIQQGRKHTVIVVGLLVLVAVVVGVQQLSDDGNSAQVDTEPAYAKVTVSSELKSGTRFSVAYEARDAAQSERLRPSSALAINLKQGDERIYILNSGFGGSEPQVLKPGEPFSQTDAELIGPTSLQYRLPDLKGGSYQLCGVVGFEAAGTGQRVRDEFCKTIKVVAG